MSMKRKKGSALFIIAAITLLLTGVLIFALGLFLQSANLLWNGVTAQATIVMTHAVNCGGKASSPGFNYTVQFTDQAGHVHLATLHGCHVTVPNTPSFPIVYLANTPETIDLQSAAPMRVQVALFLLLFVALLDAPCVGISIRLMRRAWLHHRMKDDQSREALL